MERRQVPLYVGKPFLAAFLVALSNDILEIRYYGIALLVFDVTQIHVFAIPGIPNNNLCVN